MTTDHVSLSMQAILASQTKLVDATNGLNHVMVFGIFQNLTENIIALTNQETAQLKQDQGAQASFVSCFSFDPSSGNVNAWIQQWQGVTIPGFGLVNTSVPTNGNAWYPDLVNNGTYFTGQWHSGLPQPYEQQIITGWASSSPHNQMATWLGVCQQAFTSDKTKFNNAISVLNQKANQQGSEINQNNGSVTTIWKIAQQFTSTQALIANRIAASAA